ncbi:MAG: ADP-ribose pyrophosphatase [Planctomycetota bacterium]|jgi:ADP-ribose pyrophosphatase
MSTDQGPPARRVPRHADVQLEDSQVLHHGHVFDVLRERLKLPSGLVQELDIVAHGGAVAVLPLLDDGNVILVRQYRHAIGDWLLEIPAGRLEPGEAPAEAAIRELEEETGYRAKNLVSLGNLLPAPGFCSESLALFAASDLSVVPGGGLAMDADEEIELVRIPLADVHLHTLDAKSLVAAATVLRSRA